MTVNAEYEKIVPKVNEKEFALLRESIRQNGLLIPIILNDNGVILDGHSRQKACNETGVVPRYEKRHFDSALDERIFLVKVNLERRHLNDFQKAELGMILLPMEQEKALHRIGTDKAASDEATYGKSSEKVSAQVGLSHATFERAKFVLEHADAEMKDNVRSGKTSITYAYQTLVRKNRHIETPPFPVDVFDIIMADPPWEYDFGIRGSTDLYYSTMTTDQICSLKIPIAENAILFLWATAPKIQEALKVMESWGFIYKTHMIWVKDKIGTGYYFRGKHELLLLGKKGDMPSPMEPDRPESVLFAPRLEHSQKPSEIYSMIEKMFPHRKYLELFAREKHDGWMAWGNEISEN